MNRSTEPIGPTADIDVIIPAFNEEKNIRFALQSVIGWTRRVFVVDSESTDATRDIAREVGAEVVVRPWLGYAAQKNWALDNLPLEASWIFILDSDESITPELREELSAISRRSADSVPEDGFYVNRLTYFLGKPIRRCGYFPSYNLRFFKRGRARYEQREVHEHMIVDGPTARLKHLMMHEDRRGLEHFVAKHNRYSTLEARELWKYRAKSSGQRAEVLEVGIATRRWLKYHIQPRLPLAGLWRFLYTYFLRLGILDGANGLRFCLFLSTYDTLISLKLSELKAMGISPSEAATVPAAARGLKIAEGEFNSSTGTGDGSSAGLPEPSGISGAASGDSEPAELSSVSSKASPAPPRKLNASEYQGGDREARLDRLLGNSPVPESLALPMNATNRDDLSRMPAERMERHPLADQFAELLDPARPPQGHPPESWPANGSVKVSVLIPVKNEQHNIIGCLRRLQWADEVVVIDSQSTDNTIPLAQAMGADVYQFYYSRDGWPKKKNWGLENIPWRNEWVLILDADEYCLPELAQEVRQVVDGTWSHPDPGKRGCGDGFWINRRFVFMGHWIRGCGYYPSWNVRLLRHRVGRYERIGTLGDTGSGDNEVHEHILLSTGPAGYLKEEFLHFAYPDLTAWVEKHNRYTTWEAHAMDAGDDGSVRPQIFGSPIERRRWLKRMSRHLPMRPTLRFLYSFLAQRGFRDGYPGFVMCRLLAWYELMSIAKYREMKTPNAQCEERNR